MASIRRSAVAGTFYPGSPSELAAAVQRYLAEAVPPAHEAPPKAIIVPHAGYVYSGPVAATGYAWIAARRDAIERVVLIGPAHRVPVRGLAIPESDAFETPLGRVPLDRHSLQQLLQLDAVEASDAAHAGEHSLEVQLPFLQQLLGEFELVPLVVGDASPAEVAEALECVWGGPETLIVVSSDLSHYYDYATAQRMDAETSRAIESLDPAGIGYEQACGRIPVQGLLLVARRRGLRARSVDVRSSGDTAGSRDSVVGYGSYVLA